MLGVQGLGEGSFVDSFYRASVDSGIGDEGVERV